ncbi:TPA: hypothetical protein QEM72_002657 [Pseudomonas putida]|uniref:hypothetical protein n=1 Tax=Pseudomonas putida group TaxID=136845 RepID=UPI002363F369|nr:MULTISPECIES: hypothetical protein [Pseudomonas putida group]MDD2076394.1 hypothetical protein [Pseudomonas putida]MEC4022152.1 hypothetical protein [Pseudomonas fulva]HDS1692154.1 hypothetical protein [Pseudomonas putida]
MEIAQPKCPGCGAEGLDKIAAGKAPHKSKTNQTLFQVCFCAVCGHIHGVFSGIVTGSDVPAPKIDQFGIPK